jgi:hypothetical protein
MWENLGAAFENGHRADRLSAREEQLARTVEELKAAVSAREAKLAKKDRVIAELSAEFIEAKKAAGEP